MNHHARTVTALLANLLRITALLHTGQTAAVTVRPVVEEDIPLAVAEAIARKAATAVSLP